jgi:hypothetical protein
MSTTPPTKKKVNTVSHTFLSRSAWRLCRKAIVLVMFSLVVNHIAASDNFLDGESYRFPVVGFLFTIVLLILIGIIADLNFKFYQKK